MLGFGFSVQYVSWFFFRSFSLPLVSDSDSFVGFVFPIQVSITFFSLSLGMCWCLICFVLLNFFFVFWFLRAFILLMNRNKTKAKINGSFVLTFVATWNACNERELLRFSRYSSIYCSTTNQAILASHCNFKTLKWHTRCFNHTVKTLNRQFFYSLSVSFGMFFFLLSHSVLLHLYFVHMNLNFFFVFHSVFVLCFDINFCLGFLVFNDDERGCWWLLPLVVMCAVKARDLC